jgi:tetratricopeptide (TPR) repeat protein
MFFFDWDSAFYWVLILGTSLGFVAVAWARQYLQRTVGQFGGVPADCGLSGASAARQLLKAVGLPKVAVVRSNGLNCYDPRKHQVQLRDETFDGSTLASLAIAAHEVGHAQQFASGFWPARLRLWMRPIFYGLLLAMLGLLALCFTSQSISWISIVVLGVGSLMLVVQIPTILPLEYDASRRAKVIALQEGLLAPYEESSFDRVLNAASRTYLAWESQRWIALLAGGVALICLGPHLAAEPNGGFDPGAPMAAAEPGDWQEPPFEDLDYPTFVDLTYPLLSSLGTLIPAGLLVVILGEFARPAAKRATPREPAVARNNAGTRLLQSGDLAGAVEAFSSALQLDPKLHAAYINRGSCLLRQGQLDRALADIEASLVLNPHCVDALALRGEIWGKRGDYARALADMNQALQMAPKNALALTCRGNLSLVQGDHGQALVDFEQVITHVPQYGSAYLGRAKIELARGQLDAALADCSEAIALGADPGDAYSCRAHIWLDRLAHDRAIADFTRCFPYFPDQGWLLCNRGLAYYFQGDCSRALADLDRALELNPADAIAYNNRGAAYLKTGNFTAARADLEKALDLKPDFANPHKHLAWLQATCPRAEFRDGAAALIHAQQAHELIDKDPAGYQAVLAAAYAEAGDFAKAVASQARCLEASPPEALAAMRERLHLYESGQSFRDQPAEGGFVAVGSS